MTHMTDRAGLLGLACLALALMSPGSSQGDEERPAAGGRPAIIQSLPGANAWNAGQAVGDWWAEIKRQHGHVGPWNVLGWRIAQAALREAKAEWGRHELEVICYVPPQTPFTCLVDGLSVGTGNSLGRLDLRLAEVMDYRQAFVAVRRKDGRGEILEFRPHAAYLQSITDQPVEEIEQLSRDASRLPENGLFAIRRLVIAERLKAVGIQNLFKLTDRVYSGSQPQGEAAFAALQKLGVKTVVSVDGTKPDVAGAARFGLRYVHLPVGYGGVAVSNAWLLAKAVDTSPGPVFVHCHHGKHRGPTAAALACVGVEGWTAEQALQWMELAGTATHYTGLYRSVRESRAPTRQELERLPADLPAMARVSGLADAMVKLDHELDGLKAIRSAGFRTPANQPDLSPANSSLLLWESLREILRLEEVRQRGEPFLAEMSKAESAAKGLHQLLRAAASEGAEPAFQAVVRACSSCHQAHRD